MNIKTIIALFATKLTDKVLMIFALRNGGKVKIAKDALRKMQSYKQTSQEKYEAGGVLLGRYIKDSSNIIIDRITVPMGGDIRKRSYFKKQEKRHQKIIDKAWEDSNGTCNYIGEWHTHPECYPYPSIIDKNEWKRKLKEDKFDDRYLYFIIVGTKTTKIWRGDKETLKIRKLSLDE